MSTNLIAPAGAILTLLAIAARVPYSTDADIDTWLTANELIGPNDGGIIDLTERGRVWLGMIESTPLPVAVARWGDPRQFAAIDAARFDIAAVAQRATVAAAPAAPPAGEIPPGFIPNTFTALLPGQVPGGMQRDTELEVVLRNGRKDKKGQFLKLYAGQVMWGGNPKNPIEDVIAYRIIPGDTLMVAATSLTQ